MSTPSSFYIFLPANGNASTELAEMTLSWVYGGSNNGLKLAHGSLADASIAALKHRVTIVIPGEDVLSLTAEVPGKNRQRIQQAVPYVLEDSVIDDVDELHFAISNADDNAQYNVSVINKKYFELIIQQLESVDIFADAMVADYLLLKGNNTLICDGARVLSNSTHLKSALNIETYMATTINNVADLDENNLVKDEVVKLIYCDKESEEDERLERLISNGSHDKEFCNASYQLCLIKNISTGNSVNLLQGFYKKKKNWSQAGKTWLPVAVLFLVWISIQGSLFIVDYIGLSKKNKILKAEITKIYKSTFPKSRRIIDAKAQMQQQLTSLKKRRGQSGRSFTEMLSNSASVFSKSQGLKIKSLRYYDGRINLELQIASLQALDKLKDQLNKEKGYKVEIQNASSGKGVVTARIQIIGAES
ncbi:MAG: hypothetical protein KAT06_05980 [Gammaproteobacteria bacterium]|nr:hypothetical protein [Gammaproteobacteria bacterium]